MEKINKKQRKMILKDAPNSNVNIVGFLVVPSAHKTEVHSEIASGCRDRQGLRPPL
jgi:hypothetical protein